MIHITKAESEARTLIEYCHKVRLDPTALLGAMSAIAELEKEDKLAARTLSNEARRVSALGIHKTENAEIRGKFFELLGTALIHAARNGDYDAFLRRIEWKRKSEKCFYLPREHYLRPVVAGYQDIIDHNLDLLIISLIKRGGKSQAELLFVLMLSGMFPEKSTLMEGLGDSLVKSFYNGCLEYLNDVQEYSFYEIFPDAKLISTHADEKTINLKKKNRFPTIMCRSIDAIQIGLSEATNVLCLDDCVNGDTMAQNQALLERYWNVISGDVLGRAIEGTPIVANGTRYSLQDPYGKLEDWAIRTGKRYRRIFIPALKEIGTDDAGNIIWESNYEYIRDGENKVFTTQFFLEQKELLTDRQFAAEFQQEPIETKGLLYPWEELNTYYELPVEELTGETKEPDAILGICDTKDRGTDYQFLPVAYQYGNKYYLEDCICDNSAPEILDERSANILVKHKVKLCQFESNSAGGRAADTVQEKVKEKGGHTHITKKWTTANKETKILTNSPFVKENFYFKEPFKDKDKKVRNYPANGDYAKMVKFLCGYTVMGKNKNDDVPDGMSQLSEFIQNMGTGIVTFSSGRLKGF